MKKKKNRLTKKEERNMTYILHGGMEGLKIEMKCGLVFRLVKEKGSRFLRLKKRFKVFKVGPAFDRGRTVVMSYIINLVIN